LAAIVFADKNVQVGSTDVTLQLPFDAAANDGTLLAGLAEDVCDLDMYYIRVETDEDITISSKIDITALSALTDTHTDNKAYEIGQGYYRVDFPDAVFAAGATTASIIILDANDTDILPVHIDFQLVDYDPYSTVTDILTDTAAGGDGPWTSEITPEDIREEVDTNSSQLAAIVADTNEMQADQADGGRLDTIWDSTFADSNELREDWANGGRLDTIIDSILEDTGTTLDDYLDTEIAAILADSNELQEDLAEGGRLDVIWNTKAFQHY